MGKIEIHDNRKVVIDHIVRYYLFRDSQVVQLFQGQITKHIHAQNHPSLSKTTWEIIYFLCSGMFSGTQFSVSDIYSSISVSKTAVIRYLNRLEGWGVVEKSMDQVDRRRKILDFTPQFKEVITKAVDQCVAQFSELIRDQEPLESSSSENKLRDQMARFEEFAAVSSDWFWETDENHRFNWFSDRRDRQENHSHHTLGVCRWDIHAPKTIYERIEMARHKKDLEMRKPFRDFVYRISRENGNESWFTISGNPVFDESGHFSGYIGSGKDVTDRREIVEDLRKSEERLRIFNKLSTDSNWLLDADLKVASFSMGYRKSTWRSEKELIGRALWDLYEPSNNEERLELEAFKKILIAQQPFQNFILRGVIGVDRHIVWDQVSGVPIYDHEGTFEGYQGVCKDVTEQKRQEILFMGQKRILESLIRGGAIDKLIAETLELLVLVRPETPASVLLQSSNLSPKLYHLLSKEHEAPKEESWWLEALKYDGKGINSAWAIEIKDTEKLDAQEIELYRTISELIELILSNQEHSKTVQNQT